MQNYSFSIAGSNGKYAFKIWDIQLIILMDHGRPQGGGEGGGSFPPETEKIVVEKWCYFPELYKMTEVREEGIEKG